MSLQKAKDYAVPVLVLLAVIGILALNIMWWGALTPTFPKEGWILFPVATTLANIAGLIATFVVHTIPNLRLARRKWGNMGRMLHKRELKSLREKRRMYIRHMNDSWNNSNEREMYYDLVIDTENKIGELTGRGNRPHANEPTKKKKVTSSSW